MELLTLVLRPSAPEHSESCFDTKLLLAVTSGHRTMGSKSLANEQCLSADRPSIAAMAPEGQQK